MAEKLHGNTFLERLELEGNKLGSDTLFQIAKLLRENDTIRQVDL